MRQMSEELLPCAFCGKPPVKFVNVSGWRYQCTDMDCPGHARPVDVSWWQNLQEGFLAQRKKDFEAGFDRGFDLVIWDVALEKAKEEDWIDYIKGKTK